MAPDSPTPRVLEVRRLGRLAYPDAQVLQDELVGQRKRGEGVDTLLLLEHPHVITLGSRTRGGPSHVLATDADLRAKGVLRTDTGRGGDVTYHGPGQLVGYPVFDLKPDRCDVHAYVRDLEEVLIRVVADFGVTAQRVTGLTGVWVGNDKIAAIGVRISRWVTCHGFALNVSTDLSYFDLIVPCGIVGRGVTSLERLLGRGISMRSVEDAVLRRTVDVFGFAALAETTAAPSALPPERAGEDM